MKTTKTASAEFVRNSSVKSSWIQGIHYMWQITNTRYQRHFLCMMYFVTDEEDNYIFFARHQTIRLQYLKLQYSFLFIDNQVSLLCFLSARTESTYSPLCLVFYPLNVLAAGSTGPSADPVSIIWHNSWNEIQTLMTSAHFWLDIIFDTVHEISWHVQCKNRRWISRLFESDAPVLMRGQGSTLDQLRCRVMSRRTGDRWARTMWDDTLVGRI